MHVRTFPFTFSLSNKPKERGRKKSPIESTLSLPPFILMAYLILFLLFIYLPFSSAKLNLDYYKATCPDFENVVKENVFIKQTTVSATAPGLLRLFFNDCITDGCDASILIASSAYNRHPERDADPNLSLSGDAFDIISKIKNDLELKFTAKNFTIREMVALNGAHTIGFTHCKQFSDRIYPKVDFTMHPKLAAGLRRVCQNYTVDTSMVAFNDMSTPHTFDNAYYKNILKGLGLLTSDYLLSVDPRTRPIVEEYAKDQQAFFVDFAKAMEKVSVLGVKTGNK
ncbi:unnamed protein product [Lupinus luteus]|uniref:Peroxidase n=1 Tax=Lupinus luteus TaxID=3873 RepID=A0AAV1XHG0_LUPLU